MTPIWLHVGKGGGWGGGGLGAPLVATIHPSAVLRVPEERRDEMFSAWVVPQLITAKPGLLTGGNGYWPG